MPENQTLIDVALLEQSMDDIKSNVAELKSDMKALSVNVTTALTEMKVSQAKFETTTEKVNSLDEKVICLKDDHIGPLETRQDRFDYQARITKWVAVVFFAGLMYALADKIVNLF